MGLPGGVTIFFFVSRGTCRGGEIIPIPQVKIFPPRGEEGKKWPSSRNYDHNFEKVIFLSKRWPRLMKISKSANQPNCRLFVLGVCGDSETSFGHSSTSRTRLDGHLRRRGLWEKDEVSGKLVLKL